MKRENSGRIDSLLDRYRLEKKENQSPEKRGKGTQQYYLGIMLLLLKGGKKQLRGRQRVEVRIRLLLVLSKGRRGWSEGDRG